MIAADQVFQKVSWSKLRTISFLGDSVLFFEMDGHMLKESRFEGRLFSRPATLKRVASQSVMYIRLDKLEIIFS